MIALWSIFTVRIGLEGMLSLCANVDCRPIVDRARMDLVMDSHRSRTATQLSAAGTPCATENQLLIDGARPGPRARRLPSPARPPAFRIGHPRACQVAEFQSA